MTKSTKVLNSIRTLLGMEAELELLAEAILEDGTKIATDSEEFSEGAKAFVVSEDGEKMPLPTGSYKTQDGVEMKVEDGEVSEMKKPEEEETEAGKHKDDEKPMKKEEEEEMSSEADTKDEVDFSAFCTKEQLVEALTQLSNEFNEKLASITEENTELKSELSKVQKMSAVKPAIHSQKQVTNESNTGNKYFDLIKTLKNN